MKSKSSGFDPSFPSPGKRIAIVGATGSGKTTLARQLSSTLALYHVELDSILWLPNWQKEDLVVVRLQVQKQLDQASWVCDGNYSKLRDLVWQQADTLIWLDYPFLLVFYRLFIRTIQRVFFRTKLWHNNRESFQNTFFSKNSLFLWLFKSYPKLKKDYPLILAQPKHSHLKVLRFTRPVQVRQWLKNLRI